MKVIVNLLFIIIAVASTSTSVYLTTSETENATLSFHGFSLSKWLLFVPMVLILIYGGWAFLTGKRNPSKLIWQADQTYFLGYLCTITALVVLVLLGSINENAFENPTAIMRALGIAVSSTLAGLICMIVLKGRAQEMLAREFSVIVDHVEQDIRREASSVTKSILKLGSSVGKARESFDNTKIRLDSLCGSTEELRKRFDSFRSPIELAQNNINVFVSTTKKLLQALERLSEFKLSQKVLDDFQDGIANVSHLAEVSKTTEVALKRLEEKLIELVAKVERLHEPFKNGKISIDEFNASIMELKYVLDDFVRLQQTKITGL